MSEDVNADPPVNQEAVVASYSAEVITARDKFISQLEGLLARVKGLDATGSLPERVSLAHYESTGAEQVIFGDVPKDMGSAVEWFRAEKLLKELEGQGATGAPVSDVLVVTFDPHSQRYSNGKAPSKYKVEWIKEEDGENVHNELAIYDNGYVESGLLITKLEDLPTLDEVSGKFAQSGQTTEVVVRPLAVSPAQTADIQNASAQVAQSCIKYDIL